MKIFSTDEINAMRQFTLRQLGITMRDYIEQVGEALALEIISAIEPGRRIVVFAGPDLNGAYALVAARHMMLQGIRADVYLFNIGGKRACDLCLAARNSLIEVCGAEAITEVTKMQFSMPELNRDVVVIDGIFGTERTTPLSGGYQSIVRYINEMGPYIISLDVPSGMLVDSVDVMISRNIIHAAVTLVVSVPRVAYFMKENAELLGRWKIVPIEFDKPAIEKAPWRFRVVERNDIRHLISPRDEFASKADCGDAIIFAGSGGMLGAAIMCAKGALRGGAGKVTVHGPRVGFFTLQTSVPCALYESDPGDYSITQIDLRRDYKAVAIGPGIGTADVTIDALDGFLRLANANSRAVVLDADALNCISIRPSMLNHIPVMSILTPHAGEFDRLFGQQPTSYARLLTAIKIANQRHIIIVLKGKYTAIVRPDGKVYFNPTGSAALATGGSGDVLTGVLAAFMAQGMRPEFASVAAPYIHGLAGDIAAQTHGIHGVIATDVADCIGRAIKSVTEQHSEI